ncbi:MAG: AraC family transcriptional regulator, partial [Gammaproteobacteria bacterium]|nr:AraC family transcriptional regulator [Gammaproteobacteria bacterium]
MTTHQSTLASVGEALERVLARYQINADALFLEAGITDVDRRTLDARIPIDKLHDFWARAVAATRNRCIGFEAGQAIYSTNLASLGYAWLSSATLRQGIHRLARYHRILSTGLTIIVDEQPGRVTLTVERHPDTPIQGRDACMCLVVTLCREVANPEFAPMHVCLSGPRPPCAEELMRFFACDVEFDADVDEIAVSAASADEPLPR